MVLTHAAEEPCTTVRVRYLPTAATAARRQMAAELAAFGVDRATLEAAELVLSELAANAIEHGEPLPVESEVAGGAEGAADGAPTGEFEVGWCLVGDRLRLTVVDGGSVRELRPQLFDARTLRGRGLQIVDTVCDRWALDREGGTRVIAELRL